MLRSIGKQSGESVESVLEFRGVSTAAAARHHYYLLRPQYGSGVL